MEIKKINHESVNKLCAGQVIISLTSATKELIENSLDAGATSIEIRIKDNGLDSVEVQDNGKGIPPQHYAEVANRYTTSKLKKYEDLNHLTSFGFRGEALNSLCAVSKTSAITRTKSDSTATLLVFDDMGNVQKQTPISGGYGTTIIFKDLFYSLAVRRKDFEKNYKREYAKLLACIQSYALICSDVSFSVSNIDKKGTRSKILYTPGKGGLKESISSIFGQRFLVCGLSYFETQLDDQNTELKLSGYISLNDSKYCKSNTSQQYLFLNRRPVDLPKIAKAITEVYRQLNPVIGRNMAFPTFILDLTIPPELIDVNLTPDKRQVLLQNEAQIIGKLQHSLCNHLDPDGQRAFEVTGAPQNGVPTPSSTQYNWMDPSIKFTQTEQLETLQGLIPTQTQQNQTQQKNDNVNGDMISINDTQFGKDVEDCDQTEDEPIHKSDQQIGNRIQDTNLHVTVQSIPEKQIDLVSHGKEISSRIDSEQQESDDEVSSFEPPTKRIKTSEIETPIAAEKPKKDPIQARLDYYQHQSTSQKSQPQSRLESSSLLDRIESFSIGKHNSSISSHLLQESNRSQSFSKKSAEEEEVDQDDVDNEQILHAKQPNNSRQDNKHSCHHDHHHDHKQSKSPQNQHKESELQDDLNESRQVLEFTDGQMDQVWRVLQQENNIELPNRGHLKSPDLQQRPVLQFSMRQYATEFAKKEAIKQNLELQRKHVQQVKAKLMQQQRNSSDVNEVDKNGSNPNIVCGKKVRVFSKLSAKKNVSFEAELSKQVTRADFLKMQIIGQFNQSFILTRLDDEIFILDQHACDEKFNFERLQAKSRARAKNHEVQSLISPLNLELSPPDEALIMENLELYKDFGFHFAYSPDDKKKRNASSNVDDENVELPHRLKLIAHPTKKINMSWKERIQEILEALKDGRLNQDGPLALSTLRSNYNANATEACRMSIMVGDPLPREKQKKLVQNLSTINQPWNCPHGRPTMRCLFSFARLNPAETPK